MYNDGKENKRDWRHSDLEGLTLTLIYPNGWNDFKIASGIKQDDDYENIFNFIYKTAGNSTIIFESFDDASHNFRLIMETETDIYKKINSVWQKEIDELVGKLDERNQFKMGNLKEEPENYDKYKTARQQDTITEKLLEQIDKLNLMKSPLDNVIIKIKRRLILPYQNTETITLEGEQEEQE